MIELIIKRIERNENYQSQMEDFRKKARYGGTLMDGSDCPVEKIITNVMNIEITEEQFQAIRKAVLESF